MIAAIPMLAFAWNPAIRLPEATALALAGGRAAGRGLAQILRRPGRRSRSHVCGAARAGAGVAGPNRTRWRRHRPRARDLVRARRPQHGARRVGRRLRWTRHGPGET